MPDNDRLVRFDRQGFLTNPITDPSLSRWADRSRLTANSQGKRRRVAVVCWDVTHNPAGRAYVLYRLLEPLWEVELVGPAWPRFGDSLWSPIRREHLQYHILPVSNLVDLWSQGTALALARHFELIIVSKPRLPGLLLGLLLAEQSRCPLLFDFDEDERAFNETLAVEPDDELVNHPYGRVGTELASHFWSLADSNVVASRYLQQRLGGYLVRHARDERTPLVDRATARDRFGFEPNDTVVAFIGTARAHKGVGQVIAALDAINDKRLKLLVAGAVPDGELRRALAAREAERVVLHQGFGLSELGHYLAAADLVALMQDPAAAIARSQFPAKLVDALQYGVPVVTTDVEPLREVAAMGAVDVIAPDDLADYLRAVLAGDHGRGPRPFVRRLFEDEFSFAVNRVRLDVAITEARLLSNPYGRTIPEALQSLRAVTRRALANSRMRRSPQPASIRSLAPQFDLAFFWKQNDSDLFGRRSDMVVKYLLASGRVRRVVHFDQPARVSRLRHMAAAHVSRAPSIEAMQAISCIGRALELADEPDLTRRVFLEPENAEMLTLGGRSLINQGVDEFVLASVLEAGLDPERTVAWICPVIWNLASILERMRFRSIVIDLIDDERTWPMSSDRLSRLQAEYKTALEAADVVFTNCAGNRDRFAEFRADIRVVSNGAELSLDHRRDVLPELDALPRPRIGYVGNLRDRIDWDLLESLARKRPSWSFALIGPRDENSVPSSIRALRNLHFLGPLPYKASRAAMLSFDAAIIPHRRSAMTSSMNPLKVYNYLAVGVPVVTTPIANLEEVRDLLVVKRTADGFIGALEAALKAERKSLLVDGRMQSLSWQDRVAAMLEHIDAVLGWSATPISVCRYDTDI